MPRINHFIGNYVCFFRRIKKTYYFMEWNAVARKWVRCINDFPNLTLHRSSMTQDGEVRINIATHAQARAKLIDVIADGFYLKSGDDCIPILKARSLPESFMVREYTALDTPFTVTDVGLWAVQPIIPHVPHVPHIHAPPPLMVQQQKIPKRIAWLIAEDASKTSETCPISTNIISPITASVTTCYHVFETEAINEWVQRNPVNTPCPVCRKPCEVTAAFEQLG